MQTLKDTATLAVLILLALTLLPGLGAKPVDLDLATPAEAAVETSTVPAVPEPQVRPAAICSKADAPGKRILAPAPELDLDLRQIEKQQFVWERNGKRIVIVVGDGAPQVELEPSATIHEPCDASLEAHLSS